jgi:geranylgeranyl reductase family protein
MQRCDAIVVGGGPAGSACARRLSDAGLDVRVLDKCAFPRDKTCAGWVTPEVLTLTQLDPHDYELGRTLQPVHGFQIGEIGGPMTEIRYEQPVSYGIRRCEFDHYLLERSGARLTLGHAVRTIRRSAAHWQIDDELAAPMLVGAGGHFCPVAELLGVRPGHGRVVAAQEVEFDLAAAQADACRVAVDIPELYFCRDLRGYGWCFRKGNYLNIGLGREDARGLSEHVRSCVVYLQVQGRIPRDTPARYRGHAYTLYGHNRRVRTGDGVILIGDAAGMAASPSGEGIRTAIESGILAAETILTAAGDYHASLLSRYEHKLEQRFGSPDPGHDWLAGTPGRLAAALGGWLFALPWFARRIVLEGWFLHERPTTGRAARVRSA